MISAEAPPDIGGVLKRLVFADILKDTDTEQASLYSQASKMDHYWRGNQHLVLDGGAGGYNWVPIGEESVLRYNDATGGQAKRAYRYVLNMYRGDGKKFIGVLGQRSPNVKAVPDRAGDEKLEWRVRKADEFAGICRKRWDSDRIQRQLAFIQWNFGTAFGYVRYRADKEMYGSTTEPIIKNVDQVVKEAAYSCMYCGAETPESAAMENPVCSNPQCQQPLSADRLIPEEVAPMAVQDGEQEYANGFVELSLHDCTTVAVPHFVENIEKAPWLKLEYDEDQGVLAEQYEQLVEKVGTNLLGHTDGTSEQARQVREQASSQRGYSRSSHPSRWLYTQIWIRSSVYYRIKDKSHRAWLMETFPRGACMAFVEGELVDVRHERLDEHWSYCKADVSKYINSDPVGKDFLPVCDVVNNFLNYNVATGERIQPIVLGDPRVVDFEALRKHRGTVGDILPALPTPGGDYTKAFYKFPVAEMSPELIQFSGILTEAGRQSTGILPPIFGGDSGKQTATEAEQKRVQALMQLNIPHNEGRSFWSTTYGNAAKIFGQNAAGGVQVRGLMLTPEDVMGFTELAEGGFTYEAEEGMPMTWAQKRALIWSIIDKGPEVWQLLSLGHPENAQKLLDAVGFPEWNVHQMNDKAKADKIISTLLQQQPIMGPQGPLPSIPADEFEDDHQFMVDSVKEWAQKDEALRARTEKPLGYLNVIAWGKEHRLILVMSQMPPAPAGAPVGGPQGPPGAPQSTGLDEGLPMPPEPAVDPVDAGLGEEQA